MFFKMNDPLKSGKVSEIPDSRNLFYMAGNFLQANVANCLRSTDIQVHHTETQHLYL